MDRGESLHGNLDPCIKSALPLPLIKECQYLALTSILSTPIGIVMVNQSLPTHMLQFASFLLLVL